MTNKELLDLHYAIIEGRTVTVVKKDYDQLVAENKKLKEQIADGVESLDSACDRIDFLEAENELLCEKIEALKEQLQGFDDAAKERYDALHIAFVERGARIRELEDKLSKGEPK